MAKPVIGSTGWGGVLNDHLDDMATDIAGKEPAGLSTETEAALSATYGRHTPRGQGWTAGDATTHVQAAIDRAETDGGEVVLDRMYEVSDTILIPSRVTLRGLGHQTGLRQTTPGKATLASTNYVSATGAAPSGYTEIADLRIEGENTHADSHGFILRDFYAVVSNVVFADCGGDGLRVVGKDDAGTDWAGGAMVENRLSQITAINNKGNGVNVAPTGEMITDGFLTDVVVYGRADDVSAPAAIKHASCAGWVIENVHTYGTFQYGMHLDRFYFTRLTSAQIEEGWTVEGIHVGEVQRGSHIDNVSIMAGTTPGGFMLSLVKATLAPFTNDDMQIGNLSLVQDRDVAVTGIAWSTTAADLYAGSVTVQGAYADQITVRGGAGAPKIFTNYTGRSGSPTHQTWNGGGALSFDFEATVTSFDSSVGTLLIAGAQFNNGALLVSYSGQVFLSAKNNATDGWHASLSDFAAPVGFTVAPAVTVTGSGDTRTVTVTFTPNTGAVFGGACSLSLI